MCVFVKGEGGGGVFSVCFRATKHMVGFHFKGPAERSIKNSACLTPPWLRCIIINISISQSDPVIDTQEASLEFLLGRSVHREGGWGVGGGRASERERERAFRNSV